MMKILLLCTAFNSLSQRVALILKSRGHAITVELALSPDLMISAAELASPDVIICPFLTKRVPPAVYNKWLTLIVHPGPPGDAGPSALDWTLIGDLGEHDKAEVELATIDVTHTTVNTRRKMRSHWGVTVLQAIEAFDAGPVWAFDQFPLDQYAREMTKSDLYRGPVTRAAVNAVLAAIEIVRIVATQSNDQQIYSAGLIAPAFARSHCVSEGLPFQGGRTHDRPLLKASSRDFLQLSSNKQHPLRAETITQRIRCGDSQPGVLTNLFGTPMFVYHATIQKDILPTRMALRAQMCGPGTILATRDGAVLVEVGADYPIWISHLRRPKAKADKHLHPKLPATMALMSMPECVTRLGLASDVKEWNISEGEDVDAALPWSRRQGTYQQVWVELESIEARGSRIGYIHSEFYNGAFSTSQCEILLKAINWTLAQPGLQAIVMLGGTGYFSNGIALNVIEGSPDPSAEGWANINAIDDCVQALLAPTGVVTFAAIRGNVAAGGLALATAADVVLCAESAVLNPHYRGIGLYGSEFHTYSWYERCGADVAARFAHDMLPMSSGEALKIGLVDHVIHNVKMNSDSLLSEIKSTVNNIMTSRMAGSKHHIGAPWTRPLRPTPNKDQPSLAEYMLRNKAKFLAYSFAGNGQDHLPVHAHFQNYRKQELDQMSLDFFHPHRNKRFSSRCTAFVRKLVPVSTPLRFALHRRVDAEYWHEDAYETLHKDEEELDDFDSLGQFPASAANPRMPSCRPEYIKTTLAEEETSRPDVTRNGSIDSIVSSLYSTSSEPSLSSSSSTTPSSPTSSGSSTPIFGSFSLGEKEQYHTVIAEQHPQWVPPVQVAEPKGMNINAVSALPIKTQIISKDSQQKSTPILWGCYYAENGSEDAAKSGLEKSSELLENVMRTC